MSRHCRHCREGCIGGLFLTEQQEAPALHQNDDRTASWRTDRHCPVCAEADRIADAIVAERGTLTPSDAYDYQHGLIVGLANAVAIARGES